MVIPDSWKRRYQVPIYQWIAIWVGMIAFIVVAVVGMFVWVDTQRRESDENVAEVAYIGAQQDYLNDHDRWTSCLFTVDNRANTRANWHALYDAFEMTVDSDEGRRLLEQLRSDFDARTPMLDPDDCGPEPTPPPIPPILQG
jgi:type II secretory pathway pseudopilin PulG